MVGSATLAHAVAVPPIRAITKVNSGYAPKSTAGALVGLEKNGLKLAQVRQYSLAIAVYSGGAIISTNITIMAAVGDVIATVSIDPVFILFTAVVSNNNGRESKAWLTPLVLPSAISPSLQTAVAAGAKPMANMAAARIAVNLVIFF